MKDSLDGMGVGDIGGGLGGFGDGVGRWSWSTIGLGGVVACDKSVNAICASLPATTAPAGMAITGSDRDIWVGVGIGEEAGAGLPLSLGLLGLGRGFALATGIG